MDGELLALLIAFTPVVMFFVVAIVLIVFFFLTDKAKYNRKYSFLEKCVETGMDINPDLLLDRGKKNLSSKATLKTMLLNRLAGGIVFLLTGIGALYWSILGHFKDIPFLSSVALIAVGIGFLIWYFMGKKMLAEELKDEEQTLQQLHNKER